MRWRLWCGGVVLLLAVAAVAWAQMTNRTTLVWDFESGLLTSTIAPSGAGVSITSTAANGSTVLNTRGLRVIPPATQVIGAGGIIAADSCGSVKPISAAGAVTTDTTHSLTASGATLANCHMMVCNVGAQSITIDKNAMTLLVGGADVILLANSCIGFYNTGALWIQTTAQLTAT